MKELKFAFKTKEGEVLKRASFHLEQGTNWLGLEAQLANMLSEVTGRDERVSAAILCNQWLDVKKFPDGMHFYINYDNEWGFTSAYLFRVLL